jgi:glutaredoxin
LNTKSDRDLPEGIAYLGTGMLILSSIMAILIFADRTDAEFIRLPPIWYTTREFHVIICLILGFCAALLLKAPSDNQSRRTARSQFIHSVRVFTRDDCPLCDHALETLAQFSAVLPAPELVAIDDDPELTRLHGETVPVVEIDGKIRFRGRINTILLQRLIDGTRLQAERTFETAPAELSALGGERNQTKSQ